MDQPETRTPGNDLVELLRRSAEALGAQALALYEAGHTLPQDGARPTAGENWTGLIYLAAAWGIATVPAAPEELTGFPAAIDVSVCPDLCDLIDRIVERRVLLPTTLPVLFGATLPRAVGTMAAIAVRTSFNESFPTVAIYCFASGAAAQTTFDRLAPKRQVTVGAALLDELPDISRELVQLYERLRRSAADQRLAFLADLQQALSQVWRLPTVAQQVDDFNAVCDTHVRHLARELDCPDLRVYLIDGSWAIEHTSSPGTEPPGTPPPLFRAAWASWDGAPMAAISPDDGGPLGYVLSKGKPFALHSHRIAERCWDKVRRLYPGVETLISTGLSEESRPVQLLPIAADGLPPRGTGGALLIYPIQLGDRTIGAICCNGRNKPPFVFYDWDVQSLGLFALTLGSSWRSLHSRLWAERDRRLLVRAADRIDSFSHDICQRMGSASLSALDIYRAALRTADEICELKVAFSSIKLFDRDRQEFSFHNELKNGPLWSRSDVTKASGNRRYPVARNRHPDSATEFAFQTGKPVTIDVARPSDAFSNIFAGLFTYGVYVPIFYAGDKANVVAILDVRSTEAEPFPPSIAYVLQGLGQMAGLLLAMADYQRSALEANASLEQSQRQQIEAFEDLAHQITSPHRNLNRQIEVMLRLADSWSATSSEARFTRPLLVARGHARRAYRVGRSIDLFAQLSTTGRIPEQQGEREGLTTSRLKRVLQLLVADHRSIIHHTERLSIVLDLDSLDSIYRDDIIGDATWFEQAVSNLLDNAHKYSLKDTTITVSTLLIDDGRRFAIEVSNFGYPIADEEFKRIRERGFRGREAQLHSVSGRGIGLWLVDKIMPSFGGRLDLIQGQGRGVPHRFRLVFRLRPV